MDGGSALKSQEAWWRIYPKSTFGKDLVNRRLVLDPERPPEETSFPGMRSVFVKQVNERDSAYWQIWKVMMTESDIATAIQCMEQKKTFTFGMAKGAKYPSVEVWK